MFERLKKIEGIRPLRYVGNDPIGRSVSCGDFYVTDRFVDEDIYFYVPYTTGSDYSGCTITWANYKTFEEYDDDCIHLVHGGYNTYGIVINATKLCDSEIFEVIIETLESLENYPLIDDNLLAEVEMELVEEAWECWAKDDFERVLEEKFSFADFNFPDLREFFEEKREEAWECEGYGPSMWIDIVDVVKEIEFNDVVEWAVKYTVTWNDTGECRYYDSEIAEARAKQLRGRGFHATVS